MACSVTRCRFCLISKGNGHIHSRFRIRWHRISSPNGHPIRPAIGQLDRRAHCQNFPRHTIHSGSLATSRSTSTHIAPGDLHHICESAHAALPSAFRNLISALSGTTAEA